MPREGIWASRLAGAMLVCLALLVAQPAMAQQKRTKFSDTIHVVQRKPVLQKGRFDLAPRFGMSLNDSIYRSFKVGTNANYHFTERFYVGGLFEWYNFGGVLGSPTTAYQDIATQTNTRADSAVLNWVGGLELGFAPIVGKFSLFNSAILYYDVSFTAGGIWTDSASIALPSAKGGPGGTVSISNRIFLNRWMAFNFEVRDNIYMATLKGLPDSTLTHAASASLGISLFLPTAFQYSDASDE
ncbi:MAG: outer membrane beta-barrel domain-containing protein [Bradymonadaceae bacterium]|nr:outer membrane beta-barrel domain-containing protein [Lujinxingiaceae bacterium]